ncbi:MAG: methylmalonyl-CoA mutase [Alphaproteobacteria bacterium]|nr:methylmalonyl-CoA mutase [Alphaproteobacteria bacterium]
MTDDPPLGSEFPPATREDWLKLVAAVLKDRPYEWLIAKTYDGLPIEPLYSRAADARPIAGRAPGADWALMQRVDHPDPAAANAEALHDLENGATGLTLVCAGSINADGYGIDGSAKTLTRVLEGVHLDGITIDFNVGSETRGIVRHFAALVKERKLDPASVDLRASLNPIGGMAAAGGSDKPWNELAPGFAAFVGEMAGAGFRGPFAVADGRIVHNAGGSEAHELAFAITSAIAYLRALEANGIALDAARSMIYFRLAADADQLMTIAKFRAVRKLWSRVEVACGLAPKPAYVSAETAWRMMTQRDPWVNILRATLAVFSAGLGGADAVAVLPFTAALGLPDRFARRVARNTQLLLLEESNLAKVADPVAGSGAIEDLTEKLCGAAWTLVQEIEKAGGAAAALERGLIQDKVAAVRAARQAAVARGRDALTGTSDFPNLAEVPVKVLDVKPSTPAPAPTTIAFAPMPRLRLAEPFERLRDASDRMLASKGARPKIFLAKLGAVADFTARASFAKNFFEAGGIAAEGNDGFKNRDYMLAAFKASGASIACLCSTDAIYEKEAADAAKALAAAGAIHICLAGRPRDADAMKAAGVGTFIFAGGDALATLREVHDILRLS